MWEFARANPGSAIIIVMVIAWAVTRPFVFGFRAYNRTLRARNIAAHGWPEPPMDADGDIIFHMVQRDHPKDD